MTTTYEQAKRLKEIGFCLPTFDYYRKHGDGKISHFSTSYAASVDWNAQTREIWSAPFVSNALQWIRDNKGFKCTVNMHIHAGECSNVYYICYFDKMIEYTMTKGKFDTYPEAESALLDEVLDYLEGRGR